MTRKALVKIDSDLIFHSPVLELVPGDKGNLTFTDKSGSSYLNVSFESQIHVKFFVTIQFIEDESIR